MNYKIEKIDLASLTNAEKEKIENILSNSPHASVFHTIWWNRLLSEESGIKSTTLLATHEDKPVAFYTFYFGKDEEGNNIIMSPVAKYYTIYGCPIAIPGFEDSIPKLLLESEKFHRGSFCYLVSPPNYPRQKLAEGGYQSVEGLTSIVDIEKDENVLFGAIEKRAQKSIKKAIKSGVNVVEGTIANFSEFYLNYKSLYELINEKRESKLFILPGSFCKRIWEELPKLNHAFTLVGRMGDKVTNSSIQLCYKDTVYAWLLGTNHEYREFKVDSLLYWTLIKWAKDRHYKFVDLCGIDIPSMAQFKRSFGGIDTQFYYATKKAEGYRWKRMVYFLSHPRALLKRVRKVVS